VIRAFLYDAKGEDREIDLKGSARPKLDKNQLLWLQAIGRDEGDIRKLESLFGLKRQAVADLLAPAKTSLLNNYGEYFHCTVISAGDDEATETSLPFSFRGIRLDFLVGREWLVTIADEELPFLTEFQKQDRSDTLIGVLSSASLAASLLDWHLTTFLARLERLEHFLDGLDVRLLAGAPINGGRLKEIVAARRYIAHLRRNLAPQRAVFYGLSRPDFALVAASDAVEPFQALERRFERALGYIEHGHELVRGSFELLTARLTESTNILIRRLTFLSIMLGIIGAVAGIFGMNFETDYTKTGEVGFWIVIGTLMTIVTLSLVVSRLKRWI
jgi:Mg2+ and Co2+ transporter CorA